jgi:hypothetical protein
MISNNIEVERLATFLAAYRAADSKPTIILDQAAAFTTRLITFLKAYRRFRPTTPLRSMPNAIGPERLGMVLSALSGPLADARAAGVLLNPWVMAGLRRNEVRNAAVLASFLSPSICGHLAVDFLDAILEPLRSNPAIPGRADLDAGYNVRTEHYVSGNDRDRVDLTIEGSSFVLGIEVKIDAPEGRLQLERYVETVGRWGQRRCKSAAVIFLAPFPPSKPDVSNIDWRSIVAASRRATATAKTDLTETQRLLRLFARHLATF